MLNNQALMHLFSKIKSQVISGVFLQFDCKKKYITKCEHFIIISYALYTYILYSAVYMIIMPNGSHTFRMSTN